jgi:hypothetical protein
LNGATIVSRCQILKQTSNLSIEILVGKISKSNRTLEQNVPSESHRIKIETRRNSMKDATAWQLRIKNDLLICIREHARFGWAI